MGCELLDAVLPLGGVSLRVRPQLRLKGEGTQDGHVAEFTDQLDGGRPLFVPGGVCVIEENSQDWNTRLPEPHEG